jgi:hypothetical protein
LLVNTKDKEVIKETYQKLYDWRYACFRAANYIFTHYYLQEQVKQLIYFTEDVRVKLGDITKDPEGILVTSRLNSVRKILASHLKEEVPMSILASLLMTLYQKYNSEKSDYMTGKKVLPNYKLNILIPFEGRCARRWMLAENEKDYSFKLFDLSFRTYLGKDFSDKKALLDKMAAGRLKLCTSKIQLKDNKIFLLAAFQMEKEQHQLDETIIAEASLSIDQPIVVKIGKYTYPIGTREEFLYRRLAIQAARQRVQKGIRYSRGGKGRKKKLGALDRFTDKEKNYVSSKLHLYSKMLIEICLKHRAGALLLTNQADREEATKEDEFLLRNWSYYQLKQKIAYKAERAGIVMIEE